MKRHLALAAVVVAAIVVGTADATSKGPNGLIVFAQQVDGKNQLFTMKPGDSHATQITHGPGEAINPDWSPDGKTLVFERDRDTTAGIVTASADGNVQQLLTPKGFQGQPSYSPDGKWIVYERDIAPGNNGVWLIRPDGSHKHRVTRNPGSCCDTDPNFSPDGKFITFLRVKEDERQQALFVVRPDGTGLKQLTPFSWEIAIKHDWSPDGKLIVVTTNADFVKPSQAANLVMIHPDGTGMKNLTNFKPGKNAYAGSFSPDGKQIVFRLEQGDSYAIAVVDRDGRKIQRLTKLGPDKPRFLDWGTLHP